MAADEAILSQKHDLVKLSVASGTQIASRATDVIGCLSRSPSTDRPVVVSLYSKSRNANKLISVVEIAKREMKAKDIKVLQYNALHSETIQLEPKQKQSNGSDPSPNSANGEAQDSDDAFETMGERSTDGPKQRVVPVMTIYLSISSIKELKLKYG